MGMTFRGFTAGNTGDDSNSDEKKKLLAAAAIEPLRSSGGSAHALIGNGSRIIGSLLLAGQAELDCAVEGEIEAPDTLIIGESAQIKARIHGGDIIVRGTVQGDIIATKRITLKRPARVAGNISAPNLIVEEGVLFEGKCSMVSNQSSTANQTEMRGKLTTPVTTVVSRDKVANQ